MQMKVAFARRPTAPPQAAAQGIDADAQPVRRTADAARAAGNGCRIRIRYGNGWCRVKNLWDYGIPTGKPYTLS
jgi:hypothetical protein